MGIDWCIGTPQSPKKSNSGQGATECRYSDESYSDEQLVIAAFLYLGVLCLLLSDATFGSEALDLDWKGWVDWVWEDVTIVAATKDITIVLTLDYLVL